MLSPTKEQNAQLNAIKDAIRESIKGSGYEVHGAFISNTTQAPEYLAFITLKNNVGEISHNTGIPMNDISNTAKWVVMIKNEIAYSYVNIFD